MFITVCPFGDTKVSRYAQNGRVVRACSRPHAHFVHAKPKAERVCGVFMVFV